MRKLTYLLYLFLLLTPALIFAAYNDVTLTTDTILTANSVTLSVSGSSAVVETITVNSGNFTARLLPGSSIKISSSGRKKISTDVSSQFITSACNSSESSATISMPVSHPGPYIDITVTPSDTDCSSGNESGGGGSSGGGGGGSVPTPVYTVIPGTASSVSSQSAVVTQTTTKTISTPSGVTVVITKSLKLGSQDNEVKALQQALAQDKTIYPEGLATGYYGPATQRAIIRFQKKYGIDPVGFVGPQTRKKLNEVYSQATTQETPSTPSAPSTTKTVTTPSGVTITITKSLKLGSQDNEVKALQKALAQDKTIYPEGLATGYYGPATQRAIIRFQKKYGIDPVGFVGPQTRKKLNEVYSPTPSPSPTPSSAQSSS